MELLLTTFWSISHPLVLSGVKNVLKHPLARKRSLKQLLKLLCFSPSFLFCWIPFTAACSDPNRKGTAHVHTIAHHGGISCHKTEGKTSCHVSTQQKVHPTLLQMLWGTTDSTLQLLMLWISWRWEVQFSRTAFQSYCCQWPYYRQFHAGQYQLPSSYHFSFSPTGLQRGSQSFVRTLLAFMPRLPGQDWLCDTAWESLLLFTFIEQTLLPSRGFSPCPPPLKDCACITSLPLEEGLQQWMKEWTWLKHNAITCLKGFILSQI